MPHEISPLTLSIVAGAFAVAGVVVGQIFGLLSGLIQRVHDNRLRKRQRLDKMVEMLADGLPWFSKVSACRTIEDYRSSPPPIQFGHIVLLARLSFPKLVEPASRYARGCLDYYSLLSECYNPNIPATFGAQLVLVSRSNEDVAKRSREILNLRDALADAIVEESRKIKDL